MLEGANLMALWGLIALCAVIAKGLLDTSEAVGDRDDLPPADASSPFHASNDTHPEGQDNVPR